MRDVFRIDSQNALDSFIHTVDGLHDALLREAVILHPGYVDQEGWMHDDVALPTVKLVFQSQFPEVGAVELRMANVSAFRIDPHREFRLEGELSGGEVILYLCGKEYADSSEIRAAKVEYEMLGRSFLGPRRKLIPAEE